MVAVLVAQDCVLLLVILVVRGAAVIVLGLARVVVLVAAVIVMVVQALVKISVREVVKTVVKAVATVAQDVRVGVLATDVAPIALEIVVLV